MNRKYDTDGFFYSYSAREQEEIKRIRDKYLPKEESSIERVRKIDKAVTDRAMVISLIFGVVGALILGFGMSLIMTNLSEIFGSHEDLALPLGIILGIIGGVLTALAYPLYCLVLKKGREKAAPEIIRLTDGIINK